ncbi:hypothetical protein Poli38472_003055 [Pythium oligandrum]|uniref:Cell morphogenesis protein N-terminal domain-containing protein n=1 Tax=Pythium oligandrum TaxID=41045 RepID=A0A8K1C639_PYTOL|nr:hypothetical protein Poli38472_003055 [Pythium oligandrum]|eukprot:TMW57130.1 hypothetical protein Poli38472_003055 [Pythium oligandrum]
MASRDGVLQELQREINEVMATHASDLASALSASSNEASDVLKLEQEDDFCVTEDPPSPLLAALRRLCWISKTVATRSLCETVQFLLAWLAGVQGRSNASSESTPKCAVWLVGYLLVSILNEIIDLQRVGVKEGVNVPVINTYSSERMVELVLDRCMVVFQDAFEVELARVNEVTSSGFFAFKPASSTTTSTPESRLQERVVSHWRRVLALLASCSLNPIRLRLQKQLLHSLLTAKSSNTKDHLLLKNLSEMQLGLSTCFLWQVSTVQKFKDAAAFLRMLQPLMLKPFKTATRVSAVTTIAAILTQELRSLDRNGLSMVYNMVQVSEWNSTVSDLHAMALKLSSKREFLTGGWELRVALLSLAPTEIFARYWKEDMLTLLRIQYQQNKDGGSGPQAAAILECLARSFTHMINRHFLLERRIPSDLDCMEIINTTQAWSFFAYPKHKSLSRLREQVLPPLIEISVGIAAYNVQYGIQSHLRRLLAESENSFDEKRLVGLEALKSIFKAANDGSANTKGSSDVHGCLSVDSKALAASRPALGELLGHVLIACNTHFGQDLLIEATATVGVLGTGPSQPTSRLLKDDYKRTLAIQIYAAALQNLEFLYSALLLNDEQKMLILARACIHTDSLIRECAAQVLLHVISHEQLQASTILRVLTDYLLRVSNHLVGPSDFDAFIVLIGLIRSLLEQTLHAIRAYNIKSWESRKARDESLLQVEAVCIYLLVYGEVRLSLAVIETLEVVTAARQDYHYQDEAYPSRLSVLDIFRDAQQDLHQRFLAFEAESLIKKLAKNDLGILRHLITDSSPRAGFQWSACIAILFQRLVVWAPDVTTYIWSDVNDKVIKCEPAIPSATGDSEPSNSLELARWRNLTIFATTAACPNLILQSLNDADSTNDDTSSVQSVISSSAVQALFRRLTRFFKSPSNEQKKSVVLALGSTHISSIPILTETLMKYEAEAFRLSDQPGRHASIGAIQLPVNGIPPPGSAGLTPAPVAYSRKQTKEQRARSQQATAQLHLQWTIVRIYRLLVENTQQPMILDDTAREALHRLELLTTALIEKLSQTLQQLTQASADGDHQLTSSSHIVYMMQNDFCFILRSLSALRDQVRMCSQRLTFDSKSLSGKRRASIAKDSSRLLVISFKPAQREAWVRLLLDWCRGFNSLANPRLRANLAGAFFDPSSPARDHWLQRCDVVSEVGIGNIVLPCSWVDEAKSTGPLGIEEAAMASFQRFFLCQTSFATIATLLHGPGFFTGPLTIDTPVFRWLDECLAVETSEEKNPHFQLLQDLCHVSLNELLHSETHACIEVCIEKSFSTHSTGERHVIAKHYFQCLCDIAGELRDEMTKHVNLQVRVWHAVLLQLGIDDDYQQREYAVTLLNKLLVMDASHDLEPIFRLNVRTSSQTRASGMLSGQLVNRMQVVASMFLTSQLPQLCFPMSLSILKFLAYCELSQQRKMLQVVLPWLAGVDLTQPNANTQAFDAETLLSLLFRLTTTLSVTCGDQLEQVWLTLAFSSERGADAEGADTASTTQERHPNNLSRVIQHLFMQRTTSTRLSTSKTIIWWLCRWQQAAHEVLRELLLEIDQRRHQCTHMDKNTGSELESGPVSSVYTTVQPIDDVFVFVVLMGDSSCHLSNIPSYLYETPHLRDAMMLQVVHFAFLTMFGLVFDPKRFRFDVKAAKSSAPDEHQALYVDVSQDCLVLLRNVLGQLQSAVVLLEPIVDDLDDFIYHWNATTLENLEGDEKGIKRRKKAQDKFEAALTAFAMCLPPTERALWGEVCVKEITLAILPGASLLSRTSSRCDNAQVLHCVRFGLLAFRLLTPPFHGDVFLSLLELLHHALDEQRRDPVNANNLICDCLMALRCMVGNMPISKLVLYPQIVWVSVALLNHVTDSSIHLAAVQLVVEIVQQPQFATFSLLQDVIQSKKPIQWSDTHSSVLKSLVWNLDRGNNASRSLTLGVVAQLLLVPSPTFHADDFEHLVISTMTLAPLVAAELMTAHEDEAGITSDSDLEEERRWRPNVPAVALDLYHAWQAQEADDLADIFEALLSTPSNDANAQAFVTRFAQAFIPQLKVQSGIDAGLTLCFEILVKIVAAEEAVSRTERHAKRTQLYEHSSPQSHSQDGHVVTTTLWLVQELLHEVEATMIAWRPTSSLLASLARLVREPHQTLRWQAAVRIMSSLTAISTASAVLSTPKKPQLSVSTTSSSNNNSEYVSSGGESPAGSAPRQSSTPQSKTSTPSSARKFMNLLVKRPSGTSSNGYSNNQATPSSPETPESRSKKLAASVDPLDDPSLVNRREL